jgi:hypothetical protein
VRERGGPTEVMESQPSREQTVAISVEGRHVRHAGRSR